MTTAFVLGLSITVLYFAKRWRDSTAENTELKSQVASLKRQLKRITQTG